LKVLRDRGELVETLKLLPPFSSYRDWPTFFRVAQRGKKLAVHGSSKMVVTDIHDFTTLFCVILKGESSGRFIATEKIKRDLCIFIETSRKTSVLSLSRFCFLQTLLLA